MKYNDNGTYKDIYVKSYDTLPIGTEVDYDGETVPAGWTEVDGFNEIYTTIYENDTWSGNQGNITLSDSTANYDYLEVFFASHNLGGDGFKSVKIANPNGKTINLDMVVRKSDDNVMYFLSTLYDISGTSLTLKATGASYVYNNSSNNVNTSTNYIYVKKVVGIKEV